jgi:hypothetical protein
MSGTACGYLPHLSQLVRFWPKPDIWPTDSIAPSFASAFDPKQPSTKRTDQVIADISETVPPSETAPAISAHSTWEGSLLFPQSVSVLRWYSAERQN